MGATIFLTAWFTLGAIGGVHAAVSSRRRMARRHGGCINDPLDKFYLVTGIFFGPAAFLATFATFGKDAWK